MGIWAFNMSSEDRIKFGNDRILEIDKLEVYLGKLDPNAPTKRAFVKNLTEKTLHKGQ